jgi:flagellar hook-length control protein FliK
VSAGPVAGVPAGPVPDSLPTVGAQPSVLEAAVRELSVPETPAQVFPTGEIPVEGTPRLTKPARDQNRDLPAVEAQASTIDEGAVIDEAALPAVIVPRAKFERVTPRQASPANAVATVPAGAPERGTPDLPAPAPAEGLPAPKIAAAATAPAASSHPAMPLVAPAPAEAPAPVDAPAATPTAPPSVSEQIVSAVVPLHGRGDGRHEVTLELRPEHLGTIRVEVSVEHQTVNLTLHAADPVTSRLLSVALPDLRAALGDAGLTAGQIGVGLDGGGGTGQRRHTAENGDGDVRRPGTARGRGSSVTNEPEPIRPVRPAAAGRLDLFL